MSFFTRIHYCQDCGVAFKPRDASKFGHTHCLEHAMTRQKAADEEASFRLWCDYNRPELEKRMHEEQAKQAEYYRQMNVSSLNAMMAAQQAQASNPYSGTVAGGAFNNLCGGKP
jgi:hypothetical protein